MRILIAEDSDFNKLSLEFELKKFDVQYVIVSNGQEAVDQLRKSKFNLVLMDLEMPVLNGFEATQIIRNELGIVSESTKVIALTAHKTEEIESQLGSIGFDGIINKPVSHEELSALINGPSTMLPDEDKSVLNLSVLRKMANHDEKFIKQAITLFIRSTEDVLEKVDKAISIADYEQVAFEMHKFKSQLEIMGLNDIREDSERLEELATKEGDLSELRIIYEQIRKSGLRIIKLLQSQ